MRQLAFKNSNIKLFHNDRNTWLKIDVAEERYKAKFVGEFTIKDKYGNWGNKPVYIFYTPVKHPQGSNYLAILDNPPVPGYDELRIVLMDGISAAEHEWVAAYNPETREALYSAFRHDYQEYRGLMADGGPEYFRGYSTMRTISFNIKDGELNVIERIETTEPKTLSPMARAVQFLLQLRPLRTLRGAT